LSECIDIDVEISNSKDKYTESTCSVYYCHKFLIFSDEVIIRRISICAIVFPLAESKCDFFVVIFSFLLASLFLLAFILLHFGVLSWSSMSPRRFIAPLDRSSRLDRSVKCIRTKLSKTTISNNLEFAYECIAKVGLFDLFLLDWRIWNESYSELEVLVEQFTKQISLCYSLLYIRTELVSMFIYKQSDYLILLDWHIENWSDL